MPKAINLENVSSLGAMHLASILVRLAADNPNLKRELRYDLLAATDIDLVVAEIRKRLVVIARSTSMLGWDQSGDMVGELDLQYRVITTHLTVKSPSHAFDLLLSFIELVKVLPQRLAPECLELLFQMFHAAVGTMLGLSEDVRSARLDLARRILGLWCPGFYLEQRAIVSRMVQLLDAKGLEALKVCVTEALGAPSSRERDAEDSRLALRELLMRIADVNGDVDAYIALVPERDAKLASVAWNLASRMVSVGRAEEAVRIMQGVEYKPDTVQWVTLYTNALDAAGQQEAANRERWRQFQQHLWPEPLREYLRTLPQTDQIDVEDAAMAWAVKHVQATKALSFLLHWPDLYRANELVTPRNDALDGRAYGQLSPAAELLEPKFPLAAVLVLRAMIDYTLLHNLSARYYYARKHLDTCARLDERIDSYGAVEPHVEYVARLRVEHKRKHQFWAEWVPANS